MGGGGGEGTRRCTKGSVASDSGRALGAWLAFVRVSLPATLLHDRGRRKASDAGKSVNALVVVVVVVVVLAVVVLALLL